MMTASNISFSPTAILKRLGQDGERLLFSLCDDTPALDRSSLLQQLSMHLPRLEPSEVNDSECIYREAGRLAERLIILRTPYMDYIPRPLAASNSPQSLYFEVISEEVARPILERFHYILSYRGGSLHFGLKLRPDDYWPIVIASLSPFDLTNIKPFLHTDDRLPATTIVLSRMYAFAGAPRNVITFLLSKVRSWLTGNLSTVDLLLTYVNPNVGFTGSSYKADNWIVIGEECGTRYLYLDENYRTDRYFHQYFGTCDERLLTASLGSRVALSKYYLEPLKVYVRQVSGDSIDVVRHTFDRWSPAS